MKALLTFSALLGLGATFAHAQQSCTATTASVIGTYSYTATEFGTVPLTPPGTTTNMQGYSNTQIGNFLQSIAGGGAFSSANVFYFDGAGHITIAASTSSFTGSQPVGTYTVNADCTISVTLTDTLNTITSVNGANSTQGSTTLIGLVLGGGAEVYLSEPQSATSTNGNTPLIPGEFASRLTIQLIRTYTYGCTVASLTGSYGLIGSGYVLTGTTGTATTTTTTANTQPITLMGVVTFDGGGHIIQQTVASGSPLGNFQYTGTYTINPDCAGTMTLAPATSTTTTTTTTGTAAASASTFTVNFVLTPPITYPTTSAYSASPSGNAARPGIEFTFGSSFASLYGFGIAQ